MISIIKFLHLASIVLWIGTISFFSFLAAPSIFKTLEREKASEVVGNIFPKYWMVGYVASVLSIVTLMVASIAEGVFSFFRVLILIAMTALWYYAGLFIAGSARELKARIKETESQEEKQRLRRHFKDLHSQSTVLNMIVFALGVLVVYLTALRI